MTRATLFALNIAVIAALLATPCSAAAEDLGVLPFDEEHWDLSRARVLEVDGRKAMIGTAFVRDVTLQNGVLEVDIKVPDRTTRSYPGFVFRAASPTDSERVYLRPHRAPMYDDAVQYTAVFNGVSAWQLDAGEGRTAATAIPTGEWFTLRLEIAGSRARVLLGGETVLEISELRHGERTGDVGLIGPASEAAYFSNFRWAADQSLDLGAKTPEMVAPGLVREWQLSHPIEWSNVDPHQLPDSKTMSEIKWQAVSADANGLIDIARFVAPSVAGPPTVIATTTISSKTARTMALRFGYSDRVTLFINRQPVFRGISDYRSRDSGFLGAVGLYDLVFLPLEKGDNELALQITETFGGWGFVCQDAEVIDRADGVTELWRASNGLATPESVLWDPDREVLYVSSFDAFTIGRGRGQQHLSRISADGAVLDEVWASGLSNPSGLAWRGSQILAVERSGLAIVDPEKAEAVARILIPEGRLLNDIVVVEDGTAYVSDSNGQAIYRVGADDAVERWLDLKDIGNPNGLTVRNGKLLIGVNPAHKVIQADLEDRSVDDFVILPSGLVDGLEVLPNGDLLVSFGEGWLLRAEENGTVTTVFDTSGIGRQAADIELVADQRRVYIPTYYEGHVTAIELPETMLGTGE